MQKQTLTKTQINTIIISLLMVWTTIVAVTHNYNDSDVYYIIPTGKEILANGIPHTNPFITTPNCKIIIQNWLYDVILAYIHIHAGKTGMYLFFWLQICMIILLTYRFLILKTDKFIALPIACISFLMFGYINLRPEMMTHILLLWELLILEKYKKDFYTKSIHLLPIIMLLEINMHASYWIMHYVILLPYMIPIPRTINQYLNIKNNGFSANQIKKLLLPVILSIAAMFINPYGKNMITYIWHSLTSKEFKLIQPNISEQLPLKLNSLHSMIIITTIIVLYIIYKQKNLTSTTLFMYLGFLLCTISKAKFIPMFLIGVLFLTKDLTKNRKIKLHIKMSKPEYIATIVLLISVTILAKPLLPDTSNNLFKHIDPYIHYLNQNDPDATIFTTFEYNNYFQYHGYKTYYDARPELYIKEITGKNTNILTNAKKLTYPSFTDLQALQNILTDINTDYILTTSNSKELDVYLSNHPDDYEQVLSNPEQNTSLYKKYGY